MVDLFFQEADVSCSLFLQTIILVFPLLAFVKKLFVERYAGAACALAFGQRVWGGLLLVGGHLMESCYKLGNFMLFMFVSLNLYF